MKLITAKFKGLNGSLGYRTDEVYRLVFKENNGFFIFQPKYPVEIWRADHKAASSGYCPYSSMTAFLNNWEIIKI